MTDKLWLKSDRYEHDTERWLCSQASLYRACHNRDLAWTFTACADEVKALREEVAALRVATKEAMDSIVATSEWKGYWESLINENTALRVSSNELREALVTLYYGGLLSPETCAKIEEYAAQVEEER